MLWNRYVKQGGFLAIILVCFIISSQAQPHPVVALDCYHNNESAGTVNGSVGHYTWSQTGLGGYSQLKDIVLGLGADTLSISTAMDSSILARANILIIVDPDTTTEATNPKYLAAAEDTAIDRWVQRGGVLMLLANNALNCEFTHLNELSALFGIKFNADTYSGGYNLTPLPAHPFFTGCDTIFIKDISTITVTAPAQSVLTLNGKVLMATSTKGKGTVFALGDPWLYNEYIGTADNRAIGTNVMRWLIGKIPQVTGIHLQMSKNILELRRRVEGISVLLNGRALPAVDYLRVPQVVAACTGLHCCRVR